jgi:hypothetical protein
MNNCVVKEVQRANIKAHRGTESPHRTIVSIINKLKFEAITILLNLPRRKHETISCSVFSSNCPFAVV